MRYLGRFEDQASVRYILSMHSGHAIHTCSEACKDVSESGVYIYILVANCLGLFVYAGRPAVCDNDGHVTLRIRYRYGAELSPIFDMTFDPFSQKFGKSLASFPGSCIFTRAQ